MMNLDLNASSCPRPTAQGHPIRSTCRAIRAAHQVRCAGSRARRAKRALARSLRGRRLRTRQSDAASAGCDRRGRQLFQQPVRHRVLALRVARTRLQAGDPRGHLRGRRCKFAVWSVVGRPGLGAAWQRSGDGTRARGVGTWRTMPAAGTRRHDSRGSADGRAAVDWRRASWPN